MKYSNAEIAKACFFNGFGLFFVLTPFPSFSLETTPVPTGNPISAYFQQAESYVTEVMSQDHSVNEVVASLQNQDQLELQLS